jgi:4-hydroxybenzoate polyprenyltransferase
VSASRFTFHISLIGWLLWTNILMAGSAAGWVVVTLIRLALPIDGLLISLAFLLALAFYTRDRLDEKEHRADTLTIPERTAWVQRHRLILKGVVWISFLGAIILVALRPAALPPLLVGLGFAWSYTVRWLPWRGQRLAWKHLPGMKMPFVAALWVLTTVITPAVVYGQVWRWDTWLLAVAVWALVMVQILLNDLRDLTGDRLSGTVSLPVWLGEANAHRVGYLLSLMAVLLMLPLNPLPFLLPAIYSSFLIWRYRREQDARWRFWIEAQGLIAALSNL